MSRFSKDKPTKEQRTIIFVTFETEFARSGGLGAVMKALPKQTAQYEKCSILAPYFEKITGPLPVLTAFSFPLGGRQYTVQVRQVTASTGFQTYLLSSEGFFTAPVDPYVNPLDPTRPTNPDTNPIVPEKLTEDVLFFCAAVPQALVELANKELLPSQNLVLHLQDWETACVAQTVRRNPNLQATACVLTLHNPYDRYLGNTSSSLVSDLGLHRDNVLAQMIPLVDGPLSTVSHNFADELTSDPLHTHVFAYHLQDLIVSKGLVGVDNGIFGELAFPFSKQARQQAEQGGFQKIQQEKWERRKRLAQVIEDYQRELGNNPDPIKQAWGDDLILSDPWLPVFLVPGRDDPRQKGFDVIAEAIRTIPEGKARYIFTPMPGDEGLAGLSFLQKLAAERPGEVKVFPFRLDPAPFKALQEGSSFMVMGSLYEPFGAATEAYLAGMPVVARATGGLVQQVVPYPSASQSRYGRQLVALFHRRDSAPTGFLFRELSVLNQEQGWRKIVDCAYWHQNPRGDRINDRKGTPLFDAMVQSAAWALQDAIDLYTSNQTKYAEMIYNGFKMLDKFSWERAVREYRRLYDRVCN
jgi:glycogen synthase